MNKKIAGSAIQRFDMSEDNDIMVIVISVAAISALASLQKEETKKLISLN